MIHRHRWKLVHVRKIYRDAYGVSDMPHTLWVSACRRCPKTKVCTIPGHTAAEGLAAKLAGLPQ